MHACFPIEIAIRGEDLSQTVRLPWHSVAQNFMQDTQCFLLTAAGMMCHALSATARLDCNSHLAWMLPTQGVGRLSLELLHEGHFVHLSAPIGNKRISMVAL